MQLHFSPEGSLVFRDAINGMIPTIKRKMAVFGKDKEQPNYNADEKVQKVKAGPRSWIKRIADSSAAL